jgi:hypothetical protein
MLERLDSLRDLLVKQLEVLLAQIGDWLSVERRIDIHPDVIRLSPKDGWLGRIPTCHATTMLPAASLCH